MSDERGQGCFVKMQREVVVKMMPSTSVTEVRGYPVLPATLGHALTAWALCSSDLSGSMSHPLGISMTPRIPKSAGRKHAKCGKQTEHSSQVSKTVKPGRAS